MQQDTLDNLGLLLLVLLSPPPDTFTREEKIAWVTIAAKFAAEVRDSTPAQLDALVHEALQRMQGAN